ncbi:FtsB family cell division protein [Metabacillus arenae]|uniref:Septum formation initiator family protein n=1 Tax=Metabacillus arenae TaxID=2771434 RepID=A0A926NSN1_9BACI|nr:septum formation initiator family protein [Metabacillus arenae]MBD1383181.1 septum formation initiator family protein [Metabacillus arenae]
MKSAKDRKVTQLQSQYMQQQERKEQLIKKRKKGLVRRLTVFGLLVLVSSVLMISTLFSQSNAINQKLEKKEALTKQLESLQKEQKKLEEEIVKLNDDEYIAKLARKDYFLSKDNEIIFNLPEEE